MASLRGPRSPHPDPVQVRRPTPSLPWTVALGLVAAVVAGCPGPGGDPDTKMPVNSPVPSIDPPKEETPAPSPSGADGGAVAP